MHDCDVTGDPPVQPVGEDESTVRVCVPAWLHVVQSEYVKPVHVATVLLPGEISELHAARLDGGSDGAQTGPHVYWTFVYNWTVNVPELQAEAVIFVGSAAEQAAAPQAETEANPIVCPLTCSSLIFTETVPVKTVPAVLVQLPAIDTVVPRSDDPHDGAVKSPPMVTDPSTVAL